VLRNARVAMKALPNRRTDQRDDAREHLTTATTMYREMPSSPEVKTVLRRACYDCHSNETE
jgi:hypothetical protein